MKSIGYIVKLSKFIDDGLFGDTMDVELTGIVYTSRGEALAEIERYEPIIAGCNVWIEEIVL